MFTFYVLCNTNYVDCIFISFSFCLMNDVNVMLMFKCTVEHHCIPYAEGKQDVKSCWLDSQTTHVLKFYMILQGNYFLQQTAIAYLFVYIQTDLPGIKNGNQQIKSFYSSVRKRLKCVKVAVLISSPALNSNWKASSVSIKSFHTRLFH